jgi:hypothetical protein
MHERGMIPVFWDEQYKNLDYQREQFNNSSDVALWREQGYKHDNFTGALYDMRNQMPQWTNGFFHLFEGKNIAISFYRMDTGDILPTHQDTYKKYITVYSIDNPTSIRRAIIFLEDWKPGHTFEIDGAGISNWKKGEYVLWNHDAPHSAANIGVEPRYTAQLTFTHV